MAKELDQLYLVEQISQLARQSTNAMISALLALGFVIYVVRDVLDSLQLLLWSSLILASNLYLLIWNINYRRTGLNNNNPYLFLYSYQVQSIVHGLLWGVLPFMLAEAKTAELQFLAYYVICGMAAGAVATTGMIYRIYLSFMLPMLLPIILYQLLGQNNAIFDNGGLGILIIFLIAMLSLSYAHYESIMRGVRLLFENNELLENLRVAYQRAEKASKAKSDFLSNMSHELRTPLNAIMGFSSLLISFSKSKRPEKIREFSRNINEAGKHLSALINQVLDLTSIETGDKNIDLYPVHLTDVMRECLSLLRPMAANNEIELNFENDNEKAQYVLADALRLRQVLINLISNAIKYNVKGGCVCVRCVYQNNSIMVEVKDTGLGIAEADQDSIFTAFSRAHMDAHVEGSGIGLAVTKKSLSLMNSKISFQSRQGEGSRFWFVLPVAEEPEQSLTTVEKQARANFPTHGDQIKLLYVEDNPLGMRLMEALLGSRDDIAFYQATTGIDGCAIALDIEPDIIILDINLPDIDGIEVLRRLMRIEKMRSIPIVALSASTLHGDVTKGLQAGFSRYLRKPCELEELLDMVYELTSVKK
ncbi:MAG: ATP-binding protein [Gammaproteobacteria bacterium]|nr:ATP-binding protein [Gammaproteobacteria bacterium]